jgi:predicted Fe-Mo cluster-binding NifX family protein
MKIAIESNDGITIKSPFVQTKGYLVVDVDESHFMESEYRENTQKGAKKKRTVMPVKKGQTILSDCETVISRGMDRINLLKFKENGIDVFITFKTSAKDAVKIYLKEHLLNSVIYH